MMSIDLTHDWSDGPRPSRGSPLSDKNVHHRSLETQEASATHPTSPPITKLQSAELVETIIYDPGSWRLF